MLNCVKCNKEMSNNEKSLNIKLYTLDEKKMLCVSCMAKYYNVNESVMNQKIDYYKKNGCVLFT